MPTLPSGDARLLTGLTPAIAPAAPIEVAAWSDPYVQFTGDFWFVRRDRARDDLWFSLGDVAGKGLDAALWMAGIQEKLDHLIDPNGVRLQPCGVVRAIDAELRNEMPPNRFATLVVGKVSPSGDLTIANAGHCYPLLLRSDGHIEELRSNGPAVGMLPNRCWGATHATLEQGDSLVLYSDGASEAASPDGLELGTEGVARIARKGVSLTAREMIREIRRGILAWSAGRIGDDLTLLVLKRP